MKIDKIVDAYLKSKVGGSDKIVLKPAEDTEGFLLSSESFGVIDLLAEGPTDGIVDQNGLYVNADRILCGLYLDQVPVRETIATESFRYTTFPSVVTASTPFVTDVSEILSSLGSYDESFNSIINNSDADIEKAIAQITKNGNENLKKFFSNITRTDPVYLRGTSRLYANENIKLAFIPYSGIAIEDLNISNKNLEVQICYSGSNGVVELKNRTRKNIGAETLFEQMVVTDIPNPIMNLAMSPSNVDNSSLIDRLNGGYVIIPLASGDELSISGGKVVFSSVDENCLDQTSSEISGAAICLRSFSEDLTDTYNYDGVSIEFKHGNEDQSPFNLVSRSSRSVDVNYGLKGAVDASSFNDNIDPETLQDEKPPSSASSIYESNVGSAYVDYNYAKWVVNSIGGYRANRAAHKHIVENPAVSDISATFTVSELNDTYIKGDKAGQLASAFVEIIVEVGLEGDDDIYDPIYNTLVQYKKTLGIGIEGIVAGSPFRFQAGGMGDGNYSAKWIASTSSSSGGLTLRNIPLPEEMFDRKRYVRIYRATPETFSSKRKIGVTLSAINEFYKYSFSYPLSSMVGLEINSRSFSKIPSRTYDMRLKRVLVPSNYYPLLNNGFDKRFIKNKTSVTDENRPRIYYGEWDGTFKYAWTDNPAWIVYDMLVDPVYAIGNQIEDIRDINVWSLYEIGRFCDAVDDDGYYLGVDDGYGGLEPRFSCNLIIESEQEAYDLLNSVATIFRGTVFYAGSDIDFYYDREGEVISQFTNSNVNNGEFNYSDSIKSSRYTVVEVPYMDKRDNFLQKIEYYEDEENIQKYGYIKKSFQGMGITSRGQALRFAKYALLSNKLETEQVGFTAGQEALLIQPGDIIEINDELKTITPACGYLADIDYEAKTLIIPNMETGDFSTGISMHCAVGEQSLESIFYDAYQEGQSISNQTISDLSTPKIQRFLVDSYSATGNSLGGSGIVVHLNTGQENIASLNKAQIGAFFAVETTGRSGHYYKVISLSEQGEGQYEIGAMQYEPRKFEWIENDVKFDREEEYFANLTVDFETHTPKNPSVTLSYDTSLLGQSGIEIVAQITASTEYPLADEFECTLTRPNRSKIYKTVSNSSFPTEVRFSNDDTFGEYVIEVYAKTNPPQSYKSKRSTSASVTVPTTIAMPYDAVMIKSATIESAKGSFNEGDSINGDGSWILSSKNVAVSWILQDRLGNHLTKAENYEGHWDNISIDIDLLDSNSQIVAEKYRTQIKKPNIYVESADIEAVFGEYPRTFYIRMTVNSDAPISESMAIFEINNPTPELYGWALSDNFDGIVNGFDLMVDADARARQAIEKIHLYTGQSRTAGISDYSLMTTLNVGNESKMSKSVSLIHGSLYSQVNDNKLITKESVRDNLFKNGEKIIFENGDEYQDFPSGIEAGSLYELVLGKTLDSLIYLDPEVGYSDPVNSSGISSASYMPSGVTVYDPYYPLNQISSANTTNNTAGGTGLLSGNSLVLDRPYVEIVKEQNGIWVYNYTATVGGINYVSLPAGWQYATVISASTEGGGSVLINNSWVYVPPSDNTWIFVKNGAYSLGGTTDVGKTEQSNVFAFRDNGIRLAEDRASTADAYAPMQKHRTFWTASAWLRTTNSDPQTVFDFGGESGGFQLHIGPTLWTGGYELNIRMADTTPTTTGELLTIREKDIYNMGEWFHMGIRFNTITGAGGSMSGRADVFINGVLSASGMASGSGMAQHYRACGLGKMLGQGTAYTAAPISNGFFGHMSDVGFYNAIFDDTKMSQIYRNLRNEYTFSVSTGGHIINEVSGEMPTNAGVIVSQDNAILKMPVRTLYGSEERANIVSKIEADGWDDFSKSASFDHASMANNSNAAMTSTLQGSFYISELDFINENWVWENDMTQTYLYYRDSSMSYPHGRWVVADISDNVLYHYTGENATEAGGIITGDAALTDKIIPFDRRFSTGEYLSSYNTNKNKGVSAEDLTSQKPVVRRRIYPDLDVNYKDINVRMVFEDYLGETKSYPDNSMPAMQLNYAQTARNELAANATLTQVFGASERLREILNNLSADIAAGGTVTDVFAGAKTLTDEALTATFNQDLTASVSPRSQIFAKTPQAVAANEYFTVNLSFAVSDKTADLVVMVEHDDNDSTITKIEELGTSRVTSILIKNDYTTTTVRFRAQTKYGVKSSPEQVATYGIEISNSLDSGGTLVGGIGGRSWVLPIEP